MNYITISEVTKKFNVSTRMLRYYDEIGLLSSSRMEGYAYRVYDNEAIRHLQQILTLRKLRIPLKQIGIILNDPNQREVVEIFQENMDKIDDEMLALKTIRDILNMFITTLNKRAHTSVNLNILDDAEVIKVIQALSLLKVNLKEDVSMKEINKANEVLKKIKNARIVLLPPCTVASYHYIGENPEEIVGGVVSKFVCESKLYEKMPESRMFGFNHPNPSPDREHYGYEELVIIPDDFEVPLPLVKKKFKGGLYAAHTIEFPNFNEWELLVKWVNESEKYVANYSEEGDEIMGGCLEEHLNWVYSSHMGWPENGIDGNIDLLLPIKLRCNEDIK